MINHRSTNSVRDGRGRMGVDPVEERDKAVRRVPKQNVPDAQPITCLIRNLTAKIRPLPSVETRSVFVHDVKCN